MNWGPSRWEGTNAMGDQWNGRCVGANWGTNGIGDQWELDGGPLGLAEIGWMNEKGDQYVVGDLWIGGPMRRGPMSWGTNEMGDQWVGGTNEMGDQWNGWCMGANWGTNEMGDWWVGGPMRWGTNEMGDQWDGGPLGLADDGGDEWKGGPMRWGTSDMGDQWDGGPMSSNNVLGDQWVGGPMRRGPMRWGTNEMGDQWADPKKTTSFPHNDEITVRHCLILDQRSNQQPTYLLPVLDWLPFTADGNFVVWRLIKRAVAVSNPVDVVFIWGWPINTFWTLGLWRYYN